MAIPTRELNLLPPSRRDLLTRQTVFASAYRIIQSAVFGLLVITIAGVVVAAVVQTILITTDQPGEENFTHRIDVYQQLRDTIASENLTFEVLESTHGSTIVWSDIIDDLLVRIPPGVVITKLEGSMGAQTKLSFSGKATTRNVLTVLKERLENLSWIGQVNAPLSNLIAPTNPEFVMELILAPPK